MLMSVVLRIATPLCIVFILELLLLVFGCGCVVVDVGGVGVTYVRDVVNGHVADGVNVVVVVIDVVVRCSVVVVGVC